MAMARRMGAALARQGFLSAATTRSSSGCAAAAASDFDEYRRSINGGISHKALLVDAAGTLLIPAQPAAQVYRDIGKKYGVTYTEQEILARYRWAYSQPWYQSRLRYVQDARPFWEYIVQHASGCSSKEYFEELYHYYETPEAWYISDPDADIVFGALKDAGIKIAVVSNFDTRLRPLLRSLGCYHWFDAMAISAEVEAEKPNPTIFLHACEQVGVKPEDAVHVGDDRRNDIWGARDAGCDAWLWGGDVLSFRDVAARMGINLPDKRRVTRRISAARDVMSKTKESFYSLLVRKSGEQETLKARPISFVVRADEQCSISSKFIEEDSYETKELEKEIQNYLGSEL